METTDLDASFNGWLTDKHNKLEKTAGAVVLAVELLDIVIHQIFTDTPDIPLTQVLNLLFLLFVFFQLRKAFRKRYTLDDRDPKQVAKIVRLWRYSEGHQQEKIEELVRSSNKSIGQLRSINYFIIATVALYLLFIIQNLTGHEADQNHYFHLMFDAVSYVGAFFLLRSFFVMFLPTVEGAKDTLNRKTYSYIWLGIGLMVLDYCLTKYVRDGSHLTGVFIAEFICGIVNAVVFALLIARFERQDS